VDKKEENSSEMPVDCIIDKSVNAFSSGVAVDESVKADAQARLVGFCQT